MLLVYSNENVCKNSSFIDYFNINTAGYIMEQKKEYKIDENLKGKVNLIVVEKSKRQLALYHNNELLKTYKISLGKNPAGHKQFEGDSKTPEGIYHIDSKNPKSKYFLNLGISYPNEKDKENAARHNKSAGGDIKIHGLPNGLVWQSLYLIYMGTGQKAVLQYQITIWQNCMK